MLIGLEEALPEEEADPAFDSARRSGTVLLTLPPLDTSGAPEIRATLEVVPPGVASSGGSVGPGVEVNTRGLVGWEADTGAWRLTVDVTGPAGRIFATADDASGPGAGLELTVELVKGAEGAPALVIGGDSGTRLVAEELTLSGFASLADGPPDFGVGIAAASCRLEVAAGDGDGFISSVLPGGGMAVNFELGLSWSRLEGLALAGAPGLSVSLPISLSVAGVGLEDVELSVAAAAGGALSLAAGLTVTADLGVLQAEIEGLGLRLDLAPAPSAPGNLGPLEAAVAFAPPTGIAFAVEADAVSGGGFISRDGDRYVGGLSLDVARRRRSTPSWSSTPACRTIPDGFALFATLTLASRASRWASGSRSPGSGASWPSTAASTPRRSRWACATAPPTPCCSRRTRLRDADLLVAQLDEYFPILVGNTVVGPVAEIAWGVPTIVTGQLGVVISLPRGRDRGARLGRGGAARPCGAGRWSSTWTRSARRPSAAAPCWWSRRCTTRACSGSSSFPGDAGLYVSWRSRTRSSCSRLAGSTRASSPPAHVPAVLEDLRRMRAEVDVGLGVTAIIESYFAVTSNIVQFGGGSRVDASADFLGVTYTARGWFDFDVLLQFSPFLFIADASAGVGVFAGDRELMGVDLALHLEGPDPWFATGSRPASRSSSSRCASTSPVGGQRRAGGARHRSTCSSSSRPRPWPSLGAWSTEPAAGLGAGVRAARATEAGVRVRPDDVVVVRQARGPARARRWSASVSSPPSSPRSSCRVVAVVDAGSGEPLAGLDVDDVVGLVRAGHVRRDAQTRPASRRPQLRADGGGRAPSAPRASVWGRRRRSRRQKDTRPRCGRPPPGRRSPWGGSNAARALVDTVAASAGRRTARRVRAPGVDVARVTRGTAALRRHRPGHRADAVRPPVLLGGPGRRRPVSRPRRTGGGRAPVSAPPVPALAAAGPRPRASAEPDDPAGGPLPLRASVRADVPWSTPAG